MEALKNARPDRSEPVEVKVGQKTFFDQNNTMSPQEQKAVILKATVSGVTVSIS